MSEQPLKKRFGKNDIILLLILLGIIALVTVLLLSKRSKEEGAVFIIEVDGAEYARYPIDAELSVPVLDENGTEVNTVSISGGYAKMTYANCPDQLCVHQKKIHALSETIVCLPNRVVVRVEGAEEVQLDSIAR